MGTLTKQERDALEDVFLVIHSKSLISQKISVALSMALKKTKNRLKMTNFTHFVSFFSKTKNFLSK